MGLEFIDNHLSTVFFLTIFTSTLDFFSSARVSSGDCSGFSAFSAFSAYTRGGQFKTIYERASPFLHLFFSLILECIGDIDG